jgi:hypothetical protein
MNDEEETMVLYQDEKENEGCEEHSLKRKYEQVIKYL